MSSAYRVLVTGATGMQGGAVARALHRAGVAVAALVRNPGSRPATDLAESGIQLVTGNFGDASSLRAACEGRTTVFSVQPAPWADRDSERRQAAALVGAAREAGVRHFVHTSVSGTGWRARHPDVDPGVIENYWASKEDTEALVRDAGFPAWTIVKPAFFMENFVPPKVAFMFPTLSDGELLVASSAQTPIALVSAADFGDVVAQIVGDPERFSGLEIELGADSLTFPAIADEISRVTGQPVTAACRPAAEVDAKLGRASWSPTQVWLDEVGYPARPEHAKAHGLRLPTTFRAWADARRADLRAGSSS